MEIALALEGYLIFKSSKRPKTATIYARFLKQFLFSVRKNRVEDLTLEDVDRFQFDLSKSHSATTVALYTRAIRDFFKYMSYLDVKTVRPQIIIEPRVEDNPHKTLIHSEFLKIDGMLAEEEGFNALQKRVLHNLLWDTALRISELLTLTRDDVYEGDRAAQVRIRKNRQLGWVFWSEKTATLLKKMLERREDNKSYLFKTKRGELTCRTAERWVTEISQKAEVSDISPHSYRHGHVHWIVEKGGGLVEISSKLHHVSLNSSRLYLRLNQEEQRKIADRFFD
ncbi:tyrosine-type recombinase/integrase [Patescibacteria group bacterium]|nr:tyrosine-type recombinase/integrase [Patescibacteria group bacterium]